MRIIAYTGQRHLLFPNPVDSTVCGLWLTEGAFTEDSDKEYLPLMCNICGEGLERLFLAAVGEST